MNRKIALSGLSIVAALTLMGGATFAAFTAQATATTNTFSTGTDSLLISLTNGSFTTNTIANPFTGTNVTPGFNQTYNFFLQNNGTDQLDIQAAFANGTGDAGLQGALVTQFTCSDTSGTFTPSAFSVSSMLGGSVSLGTITPGDVESCSLTVNLPTSADNTVAGKTVGFDVDFNASQHGI